MSNTNQEKIKQAVDLLVDKEAPSYMDAWLKTSTKNKKQLGSVQISV